MKAKNLKLYFLLIPSSATPTESCLDGLNVLYYNFPQIQGI